MNKKLYTKHNVPRNIPMFVVMSDQTVCYRLFTKGHVIKTDYILESILPGTCSYRAIDDDPHYFPASDMFPRLEAPP